MLAPGQLCGPPSFHQVGEVDYFRPGKCDGTAVSKLKNYISENEKLISLSFKSDK